MNQMIFLHIKLTKKGLCPTIVTLQLENIWKITAALKDMTYVAVMKCSWKNHVKNFRNFRNFLLYILLSLVGVIYMSF